jgi:HEAT repeats
MKISATTRICLFIALLVGISIWLLCAIFQPFETKDPLYQGKKLTDWAEEIDQGAFSGRPTDLSHQKQSELAISAIRHIGTNALPVAVRLCEAKDSWPRRGLAVWVEQYDNDHWPTRFPIHIKPDWEENSEGISIIWALGPAAEPAIPSLTQLLQSRDRQIAETAMMALPGVGTNAVPPLVRLLNNPGQDVRIRAAIVLAEHFGLQAHAAVPVLLDCLKNLKYSNQAAVMRIEAIYSLSFIKQDAPFIVPAISRYIQSETNNLTFKNPDFFVLRVSFAALANFGTNAETVVPLLADIIRSDPKFPYPKWPGFSGMALGTLKKIDPDAAKPFLERWNAALTNASSALDKSSQQQRTSEPVYQGRSLSEWLRDFDNLQLPEGQAAAAEAVRHIGSPALPFLVDRLSEARWKQFTNGLQSWQETNGANADYAARPINPRHEAFCGLDALGSEASGALPALEKLLHDNPPDPGALYVIARIGPAGVPVFSKYLNSDVTILKLEANVCQDMVISHSELLYPKIPVGPEAPSFDRRICEFNLQVMHAAYLEYRNEHPEMNSPPDSHSVAPPSIPVPAQ